MEKIILSHCRISIIRRAFYTELIDFHIIFSIIKKTNLGTEDYAL